MLFYALNELCMISRTPSRQTLNEAATYLSLQSLTWVGITGLYRLIYYLPWAPMKPSVGNT